MQTLLVYDSLSTRFTNVKLRGRRDDCAACSTSSELRTPDGVATYDYAAFTGGVRSTPHAGGAAEGPLRVSTADLKRMLAESEGAKCDLKKLEAREEECGGVSGGGVVLVDVRPRELYTATRLSGSMHVAMREVRFCFQNLPERMGLIFHELGAMEVAPFE